MKQKKHQEKLNSTIENKKLGSPNLFDTLKGINEESEPKEVQGNRAKKVEWEESGRRKKINYSYVRKIVLTKIDEVLGCCSTEDNRSKEASLRKSKRN